MINPVTSIIIMHYGRRRMVQGRKVYMYIGIAYNLPD